MSDGVLRGTNAAAVRRTLLRRDDLAAPENGGAMVIRGRDEIRDAYRDDDVAEAYIAERFEHPLGAMLHARQLASLAGSIEAHRPGRVLEVAPGPARLTRDVAARY